MSGKTDALIIPGFLLLLPAAAVVGTAKVAGNALSSIQEEYRAAKQAALERQRAEEERRAALARERRDKAESLLKLVKGTFVEGEAPKTNIQESPGSEASSGPKASAGAPVRAQRANGLMEQIRALRDGVERGFPETGAWSRVRTEFQSKLDSLERLAVTSPSAASQGIAILTERLERELRNYSESAAKPVVTEALASRLADLSAKLAIVSAHQELPDLVERANTMAKRLELVSPGDLDERFLAGMEASVDALVSELCVRAAGKETSAIVKGHLKDVLLSMGYRVTETPPPSPAADASMVTSIAPGVGIEFSVGGGRLRTEVVSLSNAVESASLGIEETACGLVDKVYKALSDRNIAVKEGFRLPLEPGDRLRKVALAATEDVWEESSEEKRLREIGENQ